jgi:RHS repeat-associated protein
MTALLWLIPQPTAAQCPPGTVTGTVVPGDHSSPPNPAVSIGVFCPAGGSYSGQWGSNTIEFVGVYSCTFNATNPNYFQAPTGGSATCWTDPVPPSCTHCSGGFSFSLYALQGAFNGTVTKLPSGQPAAGASVGMALGTQCVSGSSGNANANGYFDSRPQVFPFNNWGIPVFGGGSGPGSGTYFFHSGSCEDGVIATTTSSTLVTVDLFVREPAFTDPPDIRCGPGGSSGSSSSAGTASSAPVPQCAPCAAGHPVSLVTGNVYFDQADIRVPGVGADLVFTRSYNSYNAYHNIAGAFGKGWSHSYSQTIANPAPGILRLRQANGVVLYFQDSEQDNTYLASVPAAEPSWIVKQGASSYTRYFRGGGHETYDSAGLASMVDVSGNVTLIGRDGSGRLTTIQDVGSGRTLTLGYEGSPSRLTTLTGPTGLIATYTYNDNQLSAVVFSNDSGYSFTYDGSGQVLTVGDPTGRTLETHTYSDGKALTSEIADGRDKLTLSYDDLQTTVTDALGNVGIFDFTSVWGLHLVRKVTGACSACEGPHGQSQEWTYDSKGRVKSYKDGAGNTTTYQYDPATGDLVKVTDPLLEETLYTYDAQGRVLSRTLPDTGATFYTHGPAGPLTITDALQRQTTFDYTPQGKLWHVTNPRGKITTFEYHPTGDLWKVTNPLQAVTTYGYDALGRRTSTADPLLRTTSSTYNIRGQVTSVTAPDQTPEGRTTSYTYDLGGRLTDVTDPKNKVTHYVYDSYGRLQHVEDPAHGFTEYGYDLMSNLTSIEDARDKVTSFEYDTFNRVKKVIYPGNRNENFTYDAAGRLATRVDRKGITTTYTYDGGSRLTSKSYSDTTPAVAYGHDDVGRLTSASSTAESLAWQYDLAGQLTWETSGYNDSIIAYTYDPDGNRETIRRDGSLHLTYGYDDADRLTSIVWGTATFGFSPDVASQRESLTYPNGTVTSYLYDPGSRLTSVGAKLGATVITQTGYEYDKASNRTSKATPAFTEAYLYDDLYRLTQASRGTPTEAYTYDAVGNRLTSLAAPTPPWAYSDRNELLSFNATTLAYDLNGNLTSKAEPLATWGYEWDAENRLTRVLKNGSEVARFVYDPLGRRIEKTTPEAMREYLYDGEDILVEKLSHPVDEDEIVEPTQNLYVHGPGVDEPLAVQHGTGAVWYYHADGLGTILKTTDGAGAVVSSYGYDAFGLREQDTRAAYGYTSREWDSDTGLYYYRARYYDPKIGRFLSEDPIRFLGGNNFYTYVENDPVNRVDPSGLAAMGLGLGGGGSLIPIPGKPGPIANGVCAAVTDTKGNIGLLCCGGAGVGVGLSVGVEGQLAGLYCPTCETICDLPDQFVQFEGSGGFGKGGNASGGGGVSSTKSDITAMATAGITGGAGGYVGVTAGSCQLVTSTVSCNKCDGK